MIIRDAQYQALMTDAAVRFRTSLVEHLLKTFPFPTKFVPRQNVERLVDDATAKAHRYGFRATGPLRLFAECAVLVGAAFDEDPLLFWIRGLLMDTSESDEMSRASRVHMHLDNYQFRVYGASGELALPGLEQISNASPEVLVTAGTSPSALMKWLCSLHPEKCEYAGESALEKLLASAHADAQKSGFRDGKSTALLAGLKFAFGIGVCSDPLFPWLAPEAADETAAPDAYAALERRAQAYMRRVLHVVRAAKA